MYSYGIALKTLILCHRFTYFLLARLIHCQCLSLATFHIFNYKTWHSTVYFTTFSKVALTYSNLWLPVQALKLAHLFRMHRVYVVIISLIVQDLHNLAPVNCYHLWENSYCQPVPSLFYFSFQV